MSECLLRQALVVEPAVTRDGGLQILAGAECVVARMSLIGQERTVTGLAGRYLLIQPSI
jgi:hypothetical protein